jgi:pimeloyl-ACP methyl ester carboxylesterase
MPATAGLHYSISDLGNHFSPPVLLIHGAGGSHLSWPSPIRRLAGQRVYAVDLPGRENSSDTALQSVNALAERIVSWMDEMDFYRVSAVGHALGGAVALQLALAYPKRIHKLGMISATAAPCSLPGLLEELSSPSSFQSALGLVRQALAPDGERSFSVDTYLRSLSRLRKSAAYSDWLAWANFLIPFPKYLPMPCWLAVGDQDPLIAISQVQELARQMASSKLTVFQGAGHLLPMERPAELAASLKAFLESGEN